MPAPVERYITSHAQAADLFRQTFSPVQLYPGVSLIRNFTHSHLDQETFTVVAESYPIIVFSPTRIITNFTPIINTVAATQWKTPSVSNSLNPQFLSREMVCLEPSRRAVGDIAPGTALGRAFRYLRKLTQHSPHACWAYLSSRAVEASRTRGEFSTSLHPCVPTNWKNLLYLACTENLPGVAPIPYFVFPCVCPPREHNENGDRMVGHTSIPWGIIPVLGAISWEAHRESGVCTSVSLKVLPVNPLSLRLLSDNLPTITDILPPPMIEAETAEEDEQAATADPE